MAIRLYSAAIAAVAVAVALTATQAAALTVNIGDIQVEIDVESDFNDWQWTFEVTNSSDPAAKAITSFHVRGLPGDVSDTFEYEDFQPAPIAAPGWSVTTSTATSAIGWQHAGGGLANPLVVPGGTLTFGFDSDYVLSEALATGLFQVGVDIDNQPIIWSSTLSPIPLPAGWLLLTSAGLGLTVLRRRQRTDR